MPDAERVIERGREIDDFVINSSPFLGSGGFVYFLGSKAFCWVSGVWWPGPFDSSLIFSGRKVLVNNWGFETQLYAL